MNVVAVVVTYNRRELLKRNLSCLRANRPVQSIVVVNNGSTDGTTEWLKEQKDLIVIHQENVGGSGGFYRGIQHAFQLGADWIWCMDDDVFPRADCMDRLKSVERHSRGSASVGKRWRLSDFRTRIYSFSVTIRIIACVQSWPDIRFCIFLRL